MTYIEIRHLQLVKLVAETGSLSRAALSLHLTRSALSHQLRLVELAAGTRLFQRGPLRMVCTAAGERLLKTARRILNEVRLVERDLERLTQTASSRPAAAAPTQPWKVGAAAGISTESGGRSGSSR